MSQRRVLILGMGNPILSDDGVGLAVARELEARVSGAEVAACAFVGPALLDLLAGYDTVFVVDAAALGGSPGELAKLTPKSAARHLFSSHGASFFELIELGRELGLPVPRVGGVYGIEIGAEVAFGEGLSQGVQERLPSITEAIAADIDSVLGAASC